MGMTLSRKQRMATASFAMVIVTGIGFMLLHYGQRLEALSVEVLSAASYAVWVYRGEHVEESLRRRFTTGHVFVN